MANYANAKATIAANIYTNHDGQVTAEMVKTAANSIVDTLIAGGYLYAGIAKLTPTQTNPGSPDANVFYIATEPGTYTNFVGAGGSLVVADGEVAIFKFNGTWSKEVTGAATAAQVTELGQYLFELGSFDANGNEYYINTRARNIQRIKVAFGDCVCTDNLDVLKYSYYVVFWDASGNYVGNLEPNWVATTGKEYVMDDGFIRFLVRKNNGDAFNDSDIAELNNSIFIIKRESNIVNNEKISNSLVRGSLNNDGTDNNVNGTLRVRTGLYSGRVTKTSVIYIPYSLNGTPLYYDAYLFDKNGLFVERMVSNWTRGYILEPNTDGFVRLLFRKGENETISDADIAAIASSLLIVEKDITIERLDNKLAYTLQNNAPQAVPLIMGQIDANGDWATSNNKAISIPVVVSVNDRFDVMTTGIGSPILRISKVSYYDNSGIFINTDVNNNFAPYIVKKSGIVRIEVLYSNSSDISDISTLQQALFITRNDSFVLANNPFNAYSWELGMIKTDGTDLSWNAWIRTKIFIPVKAGTKIHLSDKDNYKYDVMRYNNADRSYIGNTGQMTKDQYITEDCLIRITIKKANDTNFTQSEVDAIDGIIVIEPNFDVLSVPAYYQTRVNSIVEDYVEKFDNGISYLVITDTHDDYNNETKYLSDYLQRQCAAIVKIAKKTNSLFVAMLGDITSGTKAKNHIISVGTSMMELLKEAGIPLFIVRGNHDDNSYISPLNQRTDETNMFGREFLARFANAGNPQITIQQSEDNGAYYFYDFHQKRIRVVVIDDCVNYPIEYDGDYIKYTAGQANWRGIGNTQLQWFANTALNTDYDIILLTHMSISDAIHPSDEQITGGYRGFATIQGVISAFNNHTTYSDSVVTCDFSNKTNVIILESSGDNHSDCLLKDSNNIVHVSTGTASPTIGEVSHYVPPTGTYQSVRTLNTINEALFDLVLISQDKVNRLRFGAGNNEEIAR